MEQLKQQLINDCNQSRLPLEAILFVVRDLFRDVEDTYRRIQQQQQEEMIKYTNEESEKEQEETKE